MLTLHEVSLVGGLVATALFYIQYRFYAAQANRQQTIDRFLK